MVGLLGKVERDWRTPPGPELTPGRAFSSLLAGALTGAFLTGLPVSFVWGPMAVVVTVFAFPVWLWGLVCVGGPVWAVLHAGGVRDARVGAGLGAGLAFLTAVLLGRDLGGREAGFLAEPPWIELALGAMGAAVGWVVMRSAYART